MSEPIKSIQCSHCGAVDYPCECEHEWRFCCNYMDGETTYDHETCWCGAENWGGDRADKVRPPEDKPEEKTV